MFVDLFQKYKNAAAIGPYISCEYGQHIQSFMISVDKRGLAVMKSVYRCPVGEEATTSGRMNWIIDTEVKLGKSLMEAGYELRSLLSIYSGMVGSAQGTKDWGCIRWNPTKDYPISSEQKGIIYANDHPAGK